MKDEFQFSAVTGNRLTPTFQNSAKMFQNVSPSSSSINYTPLSERLRLHPFNFIQKTIRILQESPQEMKPIRQILTAICIISSYIVLFSSLHAGVMLFFLTLLLFRNTTLDELQKPLVFILLIISYIALFKSLQLGSLSFFLTYLLSKKNQFRIFKQNLQWRYTKRYISKGYLEKKILVAALCFLFLSPPLLKHSNFLGYVFFTIGLFILGTYLLFKRTKNNYKRITLLS